MLRTLFRLPHPPPFSIRWYSHDKPLPIPPNIIVIETPEDSQKARSWISQFKQSSIPRKSVELSFSASSGPGGQHVNRTNSKATLRCSLNSEWIPSWARQTLIKSPQYVVSTKSLLITSSSSRSQFQNVNDCLSKLHNLILSTASSTLKNETPLEQKKQVAKLEVIAKGRRRKEKSHRSDLKRSRGKVSGGAWD